MHLKDFLKSTLQLDQEEVFHVDVMDGFSFFNTPNSFREKVMETFSDFQLDGRKINVEISEKAPRGGGGGKYGKRKGGDRRKDRKSFFSDGDDFAKKKKKKGGKGKKPSGFGRRARR